MTFEARIPSRLPALLVCLALALASGGQGQAWSSRKMPLFSKVHQTAIDNVLGGKLDPAALAILEAMQTTVDEDQKPAQSAEHAMTGLEKNQDARTMKPRFIAQAEADLHREFLAAREAMRTGSRDAAFQALGRAIHALEDATSPSHRYFQVWAAGESLVDQARHCLQERSYPTGQTRRRLESSVQYAYDLFTGAAPLPGQFFDAVSGDLLLPASYPQ